MIAAARDGVLRVLRASRDAGVKRVVLTSAYGAVGYGHPPQSEPFTEHDWTNVNANIAPYQRSKTLAERAAWDFIATEGNGLELSAVNPTTVIGPLVGPDDPPTLRMIRGTRWKIAASRWTTSRECSSTTPPRPTGSSTRSSPAPGRCCWRGTLGWTVGVAAESAAAILVRLVWLGVFAGAVVSLLNDPAKLDIEPIRIVDATVVFVGLTMLTGSAALLVGALSGRRSWAVAAGAGIAVAGYAFNAIANQVEEAEWLRTISPYSWAFHQPPLMDGLSPSGAIALWALSLALIAGSAWALRRRDVID